MTRAPRRPLDQDTLWRSLQEMVDRVARALDREEPPIDECLDVVVDLLAGDRGLVLLERDALTQAINGRGPGRALTNAERQEVSRTIVRKALDTNALVVFSPDDQPVTPASATSLGISAALAAPMAVRGFARAVLYVDFRTPGYSVDAAQLEFFRAAAVLMGGMIGQSLLARTARERLAVAEHFTTEAGRPPSLDELLEMPGLREVRRDVEIALAGDSPVLVLGESGTGKTLLAQALAEASGRRPVVRVVLGGSDDLNTVVSELFGHERHAFSGAATRRVGLVEYANGGTLLLDEVLNMSRDAQKLLLDFAQFGTYRPLGYAQPEPKRASVRIVAATNGDVAAAVREGRFREDLYYRLAGVRIRVPPLRERRQDIAELAERALRRGEPSQAWTLSLDLRRQLASSSYDWPGNVRELEWAVKRARDRARLRAGAATQIEATDFVEGTEALATARLADDATPRDAWEALQRAKAALEEREIEILKGALARNHGVVAHAASELGIARTTLAGRVAALRLARE